MTDNDLKQRLTDAIGLLSIPDVGPMRYRRLVAAFGSPAAAMSASLQELETVNSIARSTASSIRESADPAAAAEIADRIIKLGWQVLFSGDRDYPQLLGCTADHPPLLFRLGTAAEPDEKSIAIVGTRRPSDAGRRFTESLAAALAEAGVTIVSGMAEGIDSMAHRGALKANGRTIAVWGSSLDIIFPSGNRTLAEEIKRKGAIYSEYLPGTRPDKVTFPARNRIITGLSSGVVVVEAPGRSGALISAAHALEQGRELFAVPGSPGTKVSEGTNDLIKRGARLLTSVEDIFEELPRLRGTVESRKFKTLPELTDKEKFLVDLLSTGPLQVDRLSRSSEMAVTELLELLLALELKGIIRELSGKRFVLSDEYA